MDGQANATQTDVPDSANQSARRHRSVVRRRRPRSSSSTRRWVVARSRRRMLRTVMVCTGVLLLIVLCLYLGLSRQESASPVGGSEGGGVTGPRGTV